MSQAQGPCWVRRRLEARALVILTHTHSEQQVKLFCFAGRVCPAGYKSQELNNVFHFLFKIILFFYWSKLCVSVFLSVVVCQ